MEIKVCGRDFFIAEIKELAVKYICASYGIGLPNRGEYAIFRVDGKNYSGKFGCRYFLLTESRPVGLLFQNLNIRLKYINFSDQLFIEDRIKYFFRENIERVLLIRVTEKFKKWYIEKRVEFKTEMIDYFIFKSDLEENLLLIW